MARKKEEAEKPPQPEMEVITEAEYQHRTVANIWQHDDTGHDLTVEESMFCRSYIIDRNPVAAMRRLGYDKPVETLRGIANRYLANTEVQDCIATLAKRMCENLEITAEKVNQGIAGIAFADHRSVMEFDHTGVRLAHSRYWTRDQLAAVKSVKTGANGIEIQMYDRITALTLLAKQLNLVDDEKSAAAQAAEAGAAAAIDKIFQRIQRTKELAATPANDEEDSNGQHRGNASGK